MAANTNLTTARETKNDEFYMQWADIGREIDAYLEYDPDVFRGKVIMLPCDDPEWSNFTKFFALHFMDFGLKKLISASFAPAAKPARTPARDKYQPTLFELSDPRFDENKLWKGRPGTPLTWCSAFRRAQRSPKRTVRRPQNSATRRTIGMTTRDSATPVSSRTSTPGGVTSRSNSCPRLTTSSSASTRMCAASATGGMTTTTLSRCRLSMRSLPTTAVQWASRSLSSTSTALTSSRSSAL